MDKNKSSSQDFLRKGKQGNEDHTSLLLLESADIGSALELEETPVTSMEEQSKSKELLSSKYSTPSLDVGSEAIISGLAREKREKLTKSGDLELSRTQSTSDRMLMSSASRLLGSPKGNGKKTSIRSEEFTDLAKMISQITGKAIKAAGPDFPFTLITLMKNGSPVIAYFQQSESKIQNYKELIVTIDKQNNELREKLQALVVQYTELLNQPPQSPIKRSESSRQLKIDEKVKNELKSKIEELEDKNFELNQQLLNYNLLKEENEKLKEKISRLEADIQKHCAEGASFINENNKDEKVTESNEINISTSKGKSDNDHFLSELDQYLDKTDNDESNGLLDETGGTKRPTTSLDSEIKKYKGEADRLRRQIIEIKHKAKDDAEAMDRMRESIRNLMREKQENVSKLVDMKAKVQRAKQKKREALESVKQFEEKESEIKQVDPEMEENLNKALEEIENMKNTNKRLKNIINEQRDQMAGKDGDLEQAKEKLSDAFSEIEKYKQIIKEKETEIVEAKKFSSRYCRLDTV